MKKAPWMDVRAPFLAGLLRGQQGPRGGNSTHGLAQTEHQAQIFKLRVNLFHLRLDFQQALHARVVALG